MTALETAALAANGLQLTDSADLGAIAGSTPGMVGADRHNLVNEAAPLAARRGRDGTTS